MEKYNWPVAAISWVPIMHTPNASKPTPIATGFSIQQLLLFIVAAGMVFLFGKLVMQYLSFKKMFRSAAYISGTAVKLYQVNQPILPFSFMNAVFINKNLHTNDELQHIIRHEFIHIKEKHSFDILWAEIMCLVNWYNPFVWLLKKAIRQNLEFIADSKVVANGVDKKEYQYLLLKVVGSHQYSITTPFSFYSLKKRIAMMNKLKSSKQHLLKFIFILPMLAVMLLAFRSQINDGKNKIDRLITTARQSNSNDTVPIVSSWSAKGFLISIHKMVNADELLVVVKDKKGVTVKQIPLNEWNNNEKAFTNIYGQLPPPPPPMANMGAQRQSNKGYSQEEEKFLADNPTVASLSWGKVEKIDTLQLQKYKGARKDINAGDYILMLTLDNSKVEAYLVNSKTDQAAFSKKYNRAMLPHPKIIGVGINAKPEATIIVTEKDSDSSLSFKTENNTIAVQGNTYLIILNGKEVNKAILDKISPTDIKSVNILKDKEATLKYGDKGKNGVVIIETTLKEADL
jgi:hypothetical protein